MAKIEIIPLFPAAEPVDLKGLTDNDPPVIEPIEIHVLQNARVNHLGYVFHQGKVYEHFITPRHRGSITWKNILSTYLRKKKINVDYPVLSVAHGWYDNYYHFTLEVLIKIYVLTEQFKDVTIVFPEKINAFHQSWFELLGLSNILFLKEVEVIKSPQVISCNFANRDLNHHPILTPLFRNWIIAQLKSKGLLNSAKYSDVLFIDREKATYRKIINHDEVLDHLERHNIACLNFEELSLEEQVNAMFFAKTVYFVHGAGLTNTLFCQPGTKIVEFCHVEFNQLCFHKLALTLNLSYSRVACEGNHVHDLPGYCDLYVPLNAIT